VRGAEATADPAALRMHGAREVLAFTGGSARIVEQVEAIERSVVDSPGFAFDLSKARIETVCKTIHADRGQPVDGTPSLPKLFKATCKLLQLVPDTHLGDKAVQESLMKTLNGMMTAIQGAAFNDYVDELHEQVRIFDLTYRPSEVLFHVDREAYRDILAGFCDDEEDEGHPP